MKDPDELQRAMKELSHQHIWAVWQQGKTGAVLNDEDARLYNVMLEHPEHADLWDRLDEASESEIVRGGVNLVLHVTFHTIVENQVAMDDPVAVGQVLKVLLRKGMGRHEAIHAIANAFIPELWSVLQEKRPYNEQNYVRELRKIPLEIPEKRREK